MQTSRIKFVERKGHEPAAPSHPSEALVKKWESIIIPSVNFEDTTVEDAIEYLRMRSAELDPEELAPEKKGISFVIRAPVAQGIHDASVSLDDILAAEPGPDPIRINLRATNISAADLLVRICEEANLNCYLTSRGFRMLPPDEKINESYEKSQGIELWRTYRQAN